MGVLNKVKHFMHKTPLYKLYYSLIMPYLAYGISLWGSSKERALRIVSNSSYLCHTKPLVENSNTFIYFYSYQKELGIFMYKHKPGLLATSYDH